MRTIKNINDQNEFLENNWQLRTIQHKWSCRGYGNSKILDGQDNILSKASGCGYDRFGAAIGNYIQELFQAELNILGVKYCRGKNKQRKTSKLYYGLFYDSKKKHAYVDGACGTDSMYRILHKIGFELHRVGETSSTYNGSEFFTLEPVSKHNKKYQ